PSAAAQHAAVALGVRLVHRDAGFIVDSVSPEHLWRHASMRQAVWVLVSMGLFCGAGGQARADLMYWTNLGTNDIRRANLNGSDPQVLVGGLPGPAGIALDVTGGKMYW